VEEHELRARTKLLSWVTVGAELALIAGGALVAGCQSGGYGDLDVRTFQLEYIEPGAAHQIIDPYVFADRGGVISVDDETRTITVRETPEMLSRIEQVLQQYDQPEPSVQLHFRIVEANGGSRASDPALEDIEAALPKDVFRFQNYRQVAEAVMVGTEWTRISQRVAGIGGTYIVRGRIGEVRVAEDGGTVQLEVELLAEEFGQAFETSVNARVGQLLVLGSAQPQADRGALILAVRAELVTP
jgi:type II secretory pathway component GspD/PulD (secretin)